MAKINNGDGFKNLDLKAIELERLIDKRNIEEAVKKRGRKRKPRNTECIYCGNKKKETIVDLDIDDFENVSDLLDEIDLEEEYKYMCDSCRTFWGKGKYGTISPPCNGWEPLDAIERINKAANLGYVSILKTQTFAAPSGNHVEIEFGDVFPVARAGAAYSSGVPAKDYYSIDIMVGADKLTLFPWEFDTISWFEIMREVKDGTYTATYLGSEDLVGYFEPVPEIRELLKNTFGDR